MSRLISVIFEEALDEVSELAKVTESESDELVRRSIERNILKMSVN